MGLLKGAFACSSVRKKTAAFVEIIQFRSRKNRASEDLQRAQVASLLHAGQKGRREIRTEEGGNE
jgi:hypothetical protein